MQRNINEVIFNLIYVFLIMKKTGWFLFAFFAIGVGLYPMLYLIIREKFGLLMTKPTELLQNGLWNAAFYLHIALGVISLICGWSQFSKKLRIKRLNLHRNLGKVYILAVLPAGAAGLYLAFYATGGIIAQLGFGCLAVLWLYTTGKAYYSIRQIDIQNHQYWMIRSYALCFAAVALRLWLPFSQAVLGLEFIFAYRIVAWLCWVPNLIFSEWLVRKHKLQNAL
ncbi:DUF2306 domain-containing protein [Fulvivirgaceae bacterium BMA12]|uniref:DUF2306 domain-containing protein n=1 Tax=Agaribacillus aureus TaxID=3051825 RepID=A0ABT8LA59_9BACT|nr:DUF2306 domain-containing protein [Fulvivirgaceae bacterium BMA12]